MKRLIFLGVSLFLCNICFARDLNVMMDDALGKIPDAASKIKPEVKIISIVPFEYSKDIDVKNIETKVAIGLAKTGKFKIRDEKSLKAIIDEQKLQLSGLTQQSEMKKVGELLGADALLFGKAYISNEKLIISLELKDVATGAYIWADEFTGEDLNRIYFGPGLRTGFFNASIPTLITTPGGDQTFITQDDYNNGFFFAFMFSYIQKMQQMKAVSFSLDGIFYRGFVQFDAYDKTFTLGGKTYRYRANANYTDLKLNLCALVRVHPGYIFGWNNDLLVFYGGPGLDANYFLASGKYQLNEVSAVFDTGELSYDKTLGSALAFGGITFRVGIELNLTCNFAVFIEAYYIPDVTYKFNDVSQYINPQLTVKSGQSYGMGVRYIIF